MHRVVSVHRTHPQIGLGVRVVPVIQPLRKRTADDVYNETLSGTDDEDTSDRLADDTAEIGDIERH